MREYSRRQHRYWLLHRLLQHGENIIPTRLAEQKAAQDRVMVGNCCLTNAGAWHASLEWPNKSAQQHNGLSAYCDRVVFSEYIHDFPGMSVL